MTSTLIHHNETIFPSSTTFVTERWMNFARRKHLKIYLVSFTKGSRQCIGMNSQRQQSLPCLPLFGN
ncbi:hypothetical protein BDV19DRAFT_363740 [Aspergillus venezuelensis]